MNICEEGFIDIRQPGGGEKGVDNIKVWEGKGGEQKDTDSAI